ncbi:MAG: outer membrane beta-barrel protein [Hyphomicrobiales bacterium]
MLKTALLSLVALTLLASTAGAAGMTEGQVIGSIGGGIQIPTGDYSDAGKTGFGGILGLDYAISPVVTVGATFHYNRNSISDDLKSALELFAGQPVDGHYTVLHYGANLKYIVAPEQNTHPYFTIGGGLYNFKATLETGGVSASDSNTDGGINGGVGVLFDVGAKSHLALQGQYHDIFTSGSSTQYVNFHMVFSVDLNSR